MFTGDLLPKLQITLSAKRPDGTVVPVDITAAISNRLIGRRGTTIVIDTTTINVSVVGNTSVVEYQWVSGDTADPGRIEFEVESTFAAGKQTFPRVYEDVIEDADRAA